MSNKTVLVTGGAGYIGSHVVLALLKSGYIPIVLDDLSTGHEELIPSECEFIHGNAGDSILVSSTIRKYGIGSVMHFAGSIIVEESVDNPLKYYRNNTDVSRGLIQTCVDERIYQFIFSSTAAVYGNTETSPVSESDPLFPASPYGASKAMIERILCDVAACSPLRYISLRYFNVAGADPWHRTGQMTENATHLIKVACETALGKRSEITIFGDDYDTPDGTCIRDYIHVSDLASAHVSALEYLQSHNESLILNCGYGVGYSVKQVLDTLQSISDDTLNIRYGSRRPGDIAELVADSSRLRSLLNWEPQYNDLKQILSDAVEWEKLNIKPILRPRQNQPASVYKTLL
ncbi:UDP-glucose 4-epimerase [Methylohalomonas lacus]|uniref:UDP-glucose 4-epimerase n=1 Tax=Methylohalomonas lacus TaxID=398773 RepID=A0AAE3L1N8_9GAMM|nr:UDP-glucose 4-epimerase GalE [Methylohalomonas lacus]MCS3904344.1 UDP-glucose 4-epimerase [Methylohalomonas lacus]